MKDYAVYRVHRDNFDKEILFKDLTREEAMTFKTHLARKIAWWYSMRCHVICYGVGKEINYNGESVRLI